MVYLDIFCDTEQGMLCTSTRIVIWAKWAKKATRLSVKHHYIYANLSVFFGVRVVLIFSISKFTSGIYMTVDKKAGINNL